MDKKTATKEWSKELKYECPYDNMTHKYVARCGYDVTVYGITSPREIPRILPRIVRRPICGKPFKADFEVDIPENINIEKIEVGSDASTLSLNAFAMTLWP